MDTVTLPRAVFDELVLTSKDAAVCLEEIYQEIRQRAGARGEDHPKRSPVGTRLAAAIAAAQKATEPI